MSSSISDGNRVVASIIALSNESSSGLAAWIVSAEVVETTDSLSAIRALCGRSVYRYVVSLTSVSRNRRLSGRSANYALSGFACPESPSQKRKFGIPLDGMLAAHARDLCSEQRQPA